MGRAGPAHLARRFVGSLRPGGPDADGAEWARTRLRPGEQALWDRMSGPDRRHAVAVARRVAGDLGHEASRPVLAAALLHDVGKLDARLGTAGRVVATVAGSATRRHFVRTWSERGGLVGRVGRYLRHDELGAALLAKAGSDPVTVTWAREHHLPPDGWTLSSRVARALKQADDD